MSWTVQTRPEEIRQIDAWRDAEGGYSYVTVHTNGGRITISTDLHGGDIDRVRDVLRAMLATWDAIDPAKGGQTRSEVTPDAWATAEQAEGGEVR